MKKLKLMIVCLLTGVLFGCGTPTPSLFYWGDYQKAVYQNWEESSSVDEQIQMLQKTIQMASNKSERVAPGVHAHLGMLYLKSGQRDKGIESLGREKALYPESTQYMNFLIGQVKK